MEPLGFVHRNEQSPRGMLAAWWYRRRVRQIRDAQMRAVLAAQAAEPPDVAERKRRDLLERIAKASAEDLR